MTCCSLRRFVMITKASSCTSKAKIPVPSSSIECGASRKLPGWSYDRYASEKQDLGSAHDAASPAEADLELPFTPQERLRQLEPLTEQAHKIEQQPSRNSRKGAVSEVDRWIAKRSTWKSKLRRFTRRSLPKGTSKSAVRVPNPACHHLNEVVASQEWFVCGSTAFGVQPAQRMEHTLPWVSPDRTSLHVKPLL